MRLSELIRLGSMLKPQAFGDYSDGVGTCALGAACEAAGVDLSVSSAVVAFEKEHEAINERLCPVCRDGEHLVHAGTVAHLNDFHRWTRERIADWIETIEPRETTEPCSSMQVVDLEAVHG